MFVTFITGFEVETLFLQNSGMVVINKGQCVIFQKGKEVGGGGIADTYFLFPSYLRSPVYQM